MARPGEQRGSQGKVAALLGVAVVVWLALLIAPFADQGLVGIIQYLPDAVTKPFAIIWCENSPKTILVCLAIYALVVLVIASSQKNYRRGEEHGSARWGNPNQLCKKYQDKAFTANRILTENVRMGLDGRKTRRNSNLVVVGGAGSGKSFNFAKPNLLQANASYVVLDPKGELLRDTGSYLESQGYEIRVLDLIHMGQSHCYNPFRYLETDNDAQRLATNLFKSTTPKGSVTQDPFWDNAANILLMALILYLRYEAPEDEQNFEMVLELLRAGRSPDGNDKERSALDILFDQLEARDPDHIAVRYYNSYRSSAPQTLKSIQISLAARLEKFNLEDLASLTRTDELDLASLGERKVALFAIIPDNDTSFNFLVSILYTQIFQQLFSLADRKYHGQLPVPVHFLMDEFANVALPDDFDKILATMRSRNIFVSIILQNISQLKALFEKQWESILGNCDEFLYLGGNEQSTHEYVSKLLGKETIDTNTYGKTKGSHGSYSTNDQNAGRELMTPDEVRSLDNQYALLFIRGEAPVIDRKYNTLRHPNIGKTPMKGGAAYEWGKIGKSDGQISITLPDTRTGAYVPSGAYQTNYVLQSNEELEDEFLQED